YRQLGTRIGEWYRSLTADAVVAAHGGGVRALMALLKHPARGSGDACANRAGRGLCFRRRQAFALSLIKLCQSKSGRTVFSRLAGSEDPAKSEGHTGAAPIRGARP